MRFIALEVDSVHIGFHGSARVPVHLYHRAAVAEFAFLTSSSGPPFLRTELRNS